MRISTTINDETAIIHLSGRFGENGYRAFRDACDAHLHLSDVTNLVIDMSGVDFLNSSALGMLLQAHEKSKKHQKTFQLCNPSEKIMKILEMANFHHLFCIA